MIDCRICGSSNLKSRLDFGMLAPCGVFPANHPEAFMLTERPLEVVQCENCGLAQLAHTAPIEESFNPATFGYQSATNTGMVAHLATLATRIEGQLQPKDLVIDIGSNDGTFLGCLNRSLVRIGVDPVAGRFVGNYTNGMLAHADFWSDDYATLYEGKAKTITCFACLYDLPDPNAFMAAVSKALAPDGSFVCEVAYGISAGNWDVVCHEHLEYYTIKPLQELLWRHGLIIYQYEYTETQGGSLLFWAKKGLPKSDQLDWPWEEDGPSYFATLRRKIAEQCQDVWRFLDHAPIVRLHGLCASTKGNTLLQTFKLGPNQIPYISDASPSKHGHLTPGSLIPIISEEASREMEPDYYFILSHQFTKNLVKQEPEFKERGGTFVVPIPNLYYGTGYLA